MLYKNYVLSISFANYTKEKSGMPKVMMEQQNIYNAAGIGYVSIFSVKKTLFHNRIMLFCKFGLLIDGEYKGIYQMSQIIAMLQHWEHAGHHLLDIHIHHLIYVNIKLISELLSSCRDTPIKVYLHDFYYCCTQYNFLRHGHYCGGKGLNSKNCTGCPEYGRSIHVEQVLHRMFSTFQDRILFIAPSESTKSIFLRFHPEYNVIVIPHQKYIGNYKGNLDVLNNGDKIRIAFLGMPRKNKGWNTWEKVVNKFTGYNYKFYVFNSSDEQYQNMTKVKIAFSKNRLNAMTDALRDDQIHCAILWSIWPETYSYTCYECMAANTFIITNTTCGNIVDAVNHNRNGLILKDESELFKLLEDDSRLMFKINNFRSSTEGGPNQLIENDTIVKLTMSKKGTTEIVSKRKIVNYPLLWLLNAIMR